MQLELVLREPKVSDNKLMIRIARGDADAYIKLYNKYYNKVLSNLLKLARNRADAEDLAQEIFLKIWSRKITLNGDASFNTFLFVMTRNAYYDMCKVRARERKHARSATAEKDFSYVYNYEEIEEIDTVRAVIDSIPDQYAVALRLRMERFSLEDISKVLGISKSAVRSKLQIARKMLKERLSNTENESGA